MRRHHIKIEGDFVNVGVGLMLIEGIGRQLEPEMDLLGASVPFLKEATLKRLGGEKSTSEILFTNWLKNRVRIWASGLVN